MKVFIKNGRDSKPIDVEHLEINGQKLSDILIEVKQLKQAYTSLTEQLKTCHIIQKEKEYLIDIGGQIKKVDKLKLVEKQETQYPLKFYKIVNGQLILDKEKVGAI